MRKRTSNMESVLIRESKRTYKGVSVSMRRRGVIGTSFQEIYYDAFTVDKTEVCSGYASAFCCSNMHTLYRHIKNRIDTHLNKAGA